MKSLRNEIKRREDEAFVAYTAKHLHALASSHEKEDEDDNVFDDPNYVSPPRPVDAPPRGQSGFNKEYSAPQLPALSLSLETIREQMLLEREAEVEKEKFCPAHNTYYLGTAKDRCPKC